MAIREWTIETPERHYVRLEHSFWSGRAKIFVDEKLVFERPTTISDHGFQHQVLIDGIPCIVKVTTNGITFSYSFVENESLPEPDPKPIASKKSIRLQRRFVLFVLMLFAIFWCCIGLNLIPGPGLPPKARMFYLVLGLIHLPVLIWYGRLTKPRETPEGE